MVDSSVSSNFTLHRGSLRAFGALRPVMFQLSQLVLTSILVEVAVCIADLIAMASVTRHPVLNFIFRFSILNVLIMSVYWDILQ